ncbi:hypothetical protein MCEGE10_02439 [Flavobacteriaceae bacterium]
MKKIVFTLLISSLFYSCEVYQEPTLLSLSGEYVIDRVTLQSTENSTNPLDIIYNPGDTFVNPDDVFPMDTIYVGFTRWHLDYSVISFFPISTGTGTTNWQRQYFYQVINHNSIYDLGYIRFQVNGSVRIFKILSDENESLTLRTTGLWPYASVGPNQLVTLQLTRIGP